MKKDLKTLDWPAGVVWKKHTRKNASGEIEEVSTPYVRVRFSKDGRRRAVWQQVKSPADAERVRSRLTVKMESGETDDFAHSRTTFADLARYYEPIYLVEAEYAEGRKVAGRRSLKTPKHQFKMLCEYFGRLKLRSITYGTIKKLKMERLKTPTRRRDEEGRPLPRSITTVHRELQLLRHMLNVAVREGWLAKNPFGAGEPLINQADERKRKRLLSREEEVNLLLACGERSTVYKRRGKEVTLHDDGARRRHLRPLITCLLDTAMRAGEALKLRWDDLDFDPRRITVQEFNTKTLSERSAPITARLARELSWLHPLTSTRPDRLVFGIRSNFKRSFTKACAAAGVTGLRVHDLRRTAATRLVRGGMPLEEVSRILGHSDIQMTYRYIGVDDTTTARAAAILDALNQEAEASESVN